MADELLSGETANTFTVPEDAVANYYYCKVTAHNASGDSVAVPSNVIGPIAAASTGCSPDDLPGKLGWYKSDTGLYSDAGVTPIADGARIGQWNDNSGLGNHLRQASPSTLGPLFDADG